MSLAHALLASLSGNPSSGYDLAKHFDETISCYWKATQQQIYRELTRMEEQGWVSIEVVAQDGRPNKKIYTVTPLGKHELVEWIALPSEPTQIREDLLVKVLGGYLVPRRVLRLELERRRALHAGRLSMFEKMERQHYSDLQAVPLEEQFRYLTLRRGLRFEADWLAWCDEALELVEKFGEG